MHAMAASSDLRDVRRASASRTRLNERDRVDGIAGDRHGDAVREGHLRQGPPAPWRHVPRVRIYRPTRSVTQSGKADTIHWIVEFEPTAPPFIEPLMGWTASRDPLRPVRLKFSSKERAIAFAERQGWICQATDAREPRPRPQNYADKFRLHHLDQGVKRSGVRTDKSVLPSVLAVNDKAA